MSKSKIIRSVCYFTDSPSVEVTSKLDEVVKLLESKDYLVQTKRLCGTVKDIAKLKGLVGDGADYISLGTITYDEALGQLSNLYDTENAIFNIDLTREEIEKKHAELLFKVIAENASRTFNFTYVFNNTPSSPFFPSGTYERNGSLLGYSQLTSLRNARRLMSGFQL